jgi:hypothetical protein
MENNGTNNNWRKNIKMMWSSPSLAEGCINDGLLESLKNEMKEYWRNIKSPAFELLNAIWQENDLVMFNAPVYVHDNHKAGEY